MSNVKQYAFTLFCCSVLVSLIEYLSNDSCKKQISYITGMIILLNILAPMTYLFNKDFDRTDFDIVEPINTEIDTNDILADRFRTNLSEIIQNKLRENGIFANDIRIEIVMSDNEMSIGAIEIFADPSDGNKADEIEYLVEEYLKTDVSVYIAGG